MNLGREPTDSPKIPRLPLVLMAIAVLRQKPPSDFEPALEIAEGFIERHFADEDDSARRRQLIDFLAVANIKYVQRMASLDVMNGAALVILRICTAAAIGTATAGIARTVGFI